MGWTEWLGALAVCVWLYLLFGRGGFWRVRAAATLAGPVPPCSVAAVIPARDEEGSVDLAVGSLLRQDYPGRLSVCVVDDHSSDRTASVAATAGATVVAADPLPPGWTGKLWAVSRGIAQAAPSNPDYYLLTDADIVHAPDNLGNLVRRAETNGLDLVSLMVKLRCRSLAERALIPAFLFFFLKLYPPSKATGAAGGCILIRRQALERIGGLARIRAELIDDCALAREVRKGGRIWMGLTENTLSVRAYTTFGEIGRMISRTAFTQLRHSAPLLAGTALGLALTYLAPPALALFGNTPAAHLLGLAAWVLMGLAFLPTLRFYRRSPVWAIALPLVAGFYLGATLYSAMAYWMGRGGLWKGRRQDRRR